MPAQGRSFIESYPDCMKRLDRKFQRNYRFITNPVREQLFTMQSAMLLIQQMIKNIEKREAEGIDMSSTWDTLTSLVNDQEEGK